MKAKVFAGNVCHASYRRNEPCAVGMDGDLPQRGIQLNVAFIHNLNLIPVARKLFSPEEIALLLTRRFAKLNFVQCKPPMRGEKNYIFNPVPSPPRGGGGREAGWKTYQSQSPDSRDTDASRRKWRTDRGERSSSSRSENGPDAAEPRNGTFSGRSSRSGALLSVHVHPNPEQDQTARKTCRKT